MKKNNIRFVFFTLLANVLSLSRFAGIWIFFFSNINIESKMWMYLLLSLTDAVDGTMARLAKKNFQGSTRWGSIIEHTADKALHIPGIIFLYSVGALEGWIVWPIAVGEIYISLTVSRHIYIQFKQILMKQIVEKNKDKSEWQILLKVAGENYISENGKKKMIAYTLAGFFVFLNYIKSSLIFHGFYLTFFLVGLIFCWESRKDYV